MKVGVLLVLFPSRFCAGHPGGGAGGEGAEAGQGHEDPQGVQGENLTTVTHPGLHSRLFFMITLYVVMQ